jgi:hypothetical protein
MLLIEILGIFEPLRWEAARRKLAALAGNP